MRFGAEIKAGSPDPADELAGFIGKLVKIIYDDGGETRVRKGRIVRVGENFIEFQTFANRFVINRRVITSIKVIE